MIWVKDWNEDREDPDVDIFNIIQKVHDYYYITGIWLLTMHTHSFPVARELYW